MNNNIFKITVLLGIAISLVIVSCYYDSEEYLYGRPGSENCGDTTIFTYTGGVQPILEKYCYSCHNNASAQSLGGGIKLQDYADVKIRATNGSLYGAITHSSGYSPMPQGRSKIDDCNIRIIKKWIDAGVTNN